RRPSHTRKRTMWLHSRAPKIKRPFVNFKPTLEILEDRLAPAKFTVNTTLDEVTPGDGKLSLREAINKANSYTGADPITIVLPAAVHTIALAGAGDNANLSGDSDVTHSLTIQGAGASRTVIDSAKQDRLFDLLGSITVKFAGLTLRNGGSDSGNGGAIQAVDADIVLRGCVLSANTALKGGGITAEHGDVTLVGSTVRRNVAQGDGGGGYV